LMNLLTNLPDWSALQALADSKMGASLLTWLVEITGTASSLEQELINITNMIINAPGRIVCFITLVLVFLIMF
jgi:hypothetical protein